MWVNTFVLMYLAAQRHKDLRQQQKLMARFISDAHHSTESSAMNSVAKQAGARTWLLTHTLTSSKLKKSQHAFSSQYFWSLSSVTEFPSDKLLQIRPKLYSEGMALHRQGTITSSFWVAIAASQLSAPHWELPELRTQGCHHYKFDSQGH